MNWRDDPDVLLVAQERSARARVVRAVLLWTPIFVVCLAALLFFGFDRIALDGERGSTWFLVVVLAGLTILFAFPSIHAFLDLRSGPREHEVLVVRRWSRRDAFVVKNHFLKLESGLILEGNALSIQGVEQGERARIRYYPHSAILIWAQRASVDPAGPTSG